ncbi:gamma-glutamyltransferase [Shimia aestuarii]|uniref:Glutathione hydrolase proenzyme n=1 Tax=Shimia aestuarii TaxID=254406 RepID=A0A1I4J7P7_9RHOB|nr:gamma-glutamyltransferase [Shimia aestuarii]SFL62247.1 gamma-glutamyltranspeptidase / glutathione hydrolase [Shimia aestuarii]
MKQWLLALALGSALAVPGMAQETADAVAPEKATELGGIVPAQLQASLEAKTAGAPVVAPEWMVVAAHPLAVRAGSDILREGGTAADAMVAVQAVLGLVEPQSSGLGGGAFLVWYDAQSGEVTTLDGRETAPLSATPRLFQDEAGQPLKFFDAVVGGRSVGVPGTPMLLEEAHRRWGRAQWPDLFRSAITLAEDGFTVSPRMAMSVARDAALLASHPATAAYFLPNGTPIEAGDRLVNKSYADTLRALAGQGAEPFYTGDIAADIVSAVRTAKSPGQLRAIDLALYRVKQRPAVCIEYRAHDVCGMGPPSSGGLTVGQILGLVAPYDIAGMGPDNPQTWRLIGDASRLAFADRGRYMADSDYVPVPVKGLLAKAYLDERATLLAGDTALAEVTPGQPEFDHALNWADDDAIELPSTSHISIVDRYGNALSMTTTIENGFGSRVMVRGFLLNNELTDFSFRSHVNGVPVANQVAPGKRPRSSMAPTIVLKQGKLVLVVGSPGGSRIIGYVAKTIIAVLDWGLDAQQAVALPHLVNRFGAYDVEQADLVEPLEKLGYSVSQRDLNSGLHVISVGRYLLGGADPRREGLAYGE